MRPLTETTDRAAIVAADALEIVKRAKPLFAGKDPAVQGAALAELTSLWLAGHEQELRDGLMRLQTDTILSLTIINAQKLRGE